MCLCSPFISLFFHTIYSFCLHSSFLSPSLLVSPPFFSPPFLLPSFLLPSFLLPSSPFPSLPLLSLPSPLPSPLLSLQPLDEKTKKELETVLKSFLGKTQVLKLDLKVCVGGEGWGRDGCVEGCISGDLAVVEGQRNGKFSQNGCSFI